MAGDEAQVDFALLGPSLHAEGQQEVLLTSTAKRYSEDRLELVEALGLNVIAAEPDPIAMMRALIPQNIGQASAMILDMGELSTDIIVTYGDTPRLIRTIPSGLNSLVKAAVQNLNVKDDQARQFILKFGLAPDRLEGQVLRAIDSVLENFAAEISKSVKFFQTRYPSVQISQIFLSGFAAVVPLLDRYVSSKAGIQSQLANPWHDIKVSQTDQQHLAVVAHEFATAVGLAKRSNNG
jgi:type IV pilus assembly protein PilM